MLRYSNIHFRQLKCYELNLQKKLRKNLNFMLKTKACWVLGVFSVGGVIGCGNAGNANSNSVPVSPIDGKWESTCKLASANAWTKVVYTFSGATHFTTETASNSDDGCVKNKMNVHFEGSYAVSGENYDFTVESANVTASTDEELASWKLICSDLTWEIGKKTDLKSCNKLKDEFRKTYSIFKIDGTNLYFGKPSTGRDGKSEPQRYADLNRTFAIVKK